MIKMLRDQFLHPLHHPHQGWGQSHSPAKAVRQKEEVQGDLTEGEYLVHHHQHQPGCGKGEKGDEGVRGRWRDRGRERERERER